jgi:hypothetical protein
MSKVIKRLSVILALTFCVLFLTSCTALLEFEYRGDNPELYSVALGTIPGVMGWQSGGFFMARPPYINIREVDDFGRVLFSYSEGFGAFSVIMQRTDNNYAYFYTHYNHMVVPVRGTGYSAREEQRNLYNEMIEELKIANNWNQPMSDGSEFDGVRIVRRRERGSTPEEALQSAYIEFLSSLETERTLQWRSSLMLFLRADRYGRAVYRFAFRDTDWDASRIWAVVFKPDYSFDIETSVVELIGDDYQTDLRLLMEANGWNTPP